MPEKIISTEDPLKAALNKVTGDFQFQWKFREFTTNDKRYWNGHVSYLTLLRTCGILSKLCFEAHQDRRESRSVPP